MRYTHKKPKYIEKPSFVPIKDRIEYGGAMIGVEERQAITDVIAQQGGKRWTIGPESKAFEKELADTTGVKHAVVVNSGSSALLLALSALKLPKQANVLIPALNFPTAFNAILQNGLNPVVIDIDPATMNISIEQVKEVCKYWEIDAVIAVDIAGNPVDLRALRKVVGNAKIILDNCDGYGTKLSGKFIDTYADISCVSFHAAHIITTGEGGAVFTNDGKLAKTVKSMREWGRASGTDKIYEYPGFPDDYRERYVYEEIGYNLKPLELQCAMGRVQLKRLTDFHTKRAENFRKLEKIFAKHTVFRTMEYLEDSEPCWFSFPFMCDSIERKLVMDTLESNNIECRTIFSGNITKHPAYKDVHFNIPLNDLRYSDEVMGNGVFISTHPSLDDDMINFIGSVLEQL